MGYGWVSRLFRDLCNLGYGYVFMGVVIFWLSGYCFYLDFVVFYVNYVEVGFRLNDYEV